MIKVGIVGVTGMAGEESLKILLGHPEVEITYIGSDHAAGSDIGDLIPELKGIFQMKCEALDAGIVAKKADVIFLCKEAGFGMSVVPDLLKAGKKVIDLGPDYRIFDAAVFEKYYKLKHTSSKLLKEAVYGLPELYRDKIAKADLVANPGCYPTSAILGATPILKNSSIDVDFSPVCVSAYSGFSGSGKKYSETTKNLFVEAYGNLRPYNIGRHRHISEIQQVFSDAAKKQIDVSFVPHTVPIDRGILSTIFIQYKSAKKIKEHELIEMYEKFYKNEPFIRVLEEGSCATTQAVIHSNICEISTHSIELEASKKKSDITGQIVIISAIDNLVKGAAGQAVQNMNIMCGIDEVAGLEFRNI